MKKNKIMLSVISGLLVAAVAVGGTLAYLSDKTDTVTNTFNVGSGYEWDEDHEHQGLWLDETDKIGEENPTVIDYVNRTESGVAYDEMYPATVVAKDPTFHLTEGSTESYVFAEVKGLDAISAAGYFFSAQPLATIFDPETSDLHPNWVKVADDGVDGATEFDGLYIYKTPVGGENYSYEMEPMFINVKLGAAVENDEFVKITEQTIQVRGVAVQTANLTAELAQVEAENVLAANP